MARARQRTAVLEFAAPTPEPVVEPRVEQLFDEIPSTELVPLDTTEGLFDAIPEAAPAPGLIASELSEDERKEFAKLLNEAIPLADRARLLVKLAHHTDTKRAPVALRAIQEINALTGVSADRPTDTMPVFVLASDQTVAVVAKKVEK